MSYREEIGAELQTIRVQKGLTVRELGEMCGIQHSSIVKIENGKYNVSVDILGKVADALGHRLTFEEKGPQRNSMCEAVNRLQQGNLTLGELRTILGDEYPNMWVLRDTGSGLINDYEDDDIVVEINHENVCSEFERVSVKVVRR